MIDKKKLDKWKIEDSSKLYYKIAIGYDPEMKEEYINDNGFELTSKISDKEKFTKILQKYITNHIGNNFMVGLEYSQYSWYPLWLRKEYKDHEEIYKYLNTIVWPKRRYFGRFKINKLNPFLRIFIDYPLKYEYQDIEMFSLEKEYVLSISHHGYIEFVTNKKENLREIAKSLDEDGTTVFPRDYFI